MRFTDLTALSKEGDNLYSAAGGQTPNTGHQTRKSTRARWRSPTCSSVAEITRLIDITRAYERVTQMISQTQDLSDTAIQRLGKAA